MAVELRIDTAGIGEVLKSAEVGAVIDGLAADVAERVRSYDAEADANVSSYTFDRRAASVTFVHRNSADLEARDGVLTQAAAAVGLEVRRR